MIPDLSASALVQRVRSYYPAGLVPDDPEYKGSVEAQRLMQFLANAQKDMSAWKSFVQHVRKALPECLLWDSTLLVHEPCYRLRVSLPRQDPNLEQSQEVVCLLSLLAPAYVLYASYSLYTGPTAEQWTRYSPLPPAFQDCEARLAGLVEATFNVTRLPNEVLFTPVPDLRPLSGNFSLGKARLIDLLFTEDRW